MGKQEALGMEGSQELKHFLTINTGHKSYHWEKMHKSNAVQVIVKHCIIPGAQHIVYMYIMVMPPVNRKQPDNRLASSRCGSVVCTIQLKSCSIFKTMMSDKQLNQKSHNKNGLHEMIRYDRRV